MSTPNTLVAGDVPHQVRTGTVEIVIPVYNEERALPGCVRTLHRYLAEGFPLDWRITVVDNASTDRTYQVARELAATYPRVHVLRLDRKGRGLALRTAWAASTADVVAYMDVDLSTGLDALLPLVAPLLSGHSDIAIGSRLAPGARTRRGPKREIISRCYNALIRLGFGSRFTDAQCGFKAARTEAVRPLLAATEDDSWFFDTELLLLAEHNGLRVHEVPVDWVEDVDSRVDVVRTALDDLRGLLRMARAMANGRARVPVPARPEPTPAHPDAVLGPPRSGLLWRLASFGAIGAVSTVAHVVLYALLRTWWSPLAANLVALLACTVANTEANRRWTFPGSGGVRGLVHIQAGLLFALNYVVTSGSLVALRALAGGTSRAVEVAVLVAASAVATGARFLLLDRWVFRRRTAPSNRKG